MFTLIVKNLYAFFCLCTDFSSTELAQVDVVLIYFALKYYYKRNLWAPNKYFFSLSDCCYVCSIAIYSSVSITCLYFFATVE